MITRVAPRSDSEVFEKIVRLPSSFTFRLTLGTAETNILALGEVCAIVGESNVMLRAINVIAETSCKIRDVIHLFSTNIKSDVLFYDMWIERKYN